eukprot:gb/GEZN01007365.1/.p1 GENE.gb/GEZN01007365.1/~~gb/GEZN01007365.1/.p1  ORF type:complete len:463 (-),score=8.04 gb/GEZN01007365.1/:53-1441(-)
MPSEQGLQSKATDTGGPSSNTMKQENTAITHAAPLSMRWREIVVVVIVCLICGIMLFFVVAPATYHSSHTNTRPERSPITTLRRKLSASPRPHDQSNKNATPPNKPPRVLVIAIGNVRGGLFAWESLSRYVLQPLQADLLVAVGVRAEEAGKTRESHIVKLAKYYVPILEPDDWGIILNQAMYGLLGDGNRTDWVNLCTVNSGGSYMGGIKDPRCKHQRARTAAQLGLRWIVYKYLIASARYMDYDRFILTRTDYMYICRFPPLHTLDPQYVWTQICGSFWGYSDRVTVASQDNILQILEWPLAITTKPTEWTEKYRACHVKNFESAWKCYIENKLPNKTRFFLHPAVVVAHKNDTSTWSKKTHVPDFTVPHTFIKSHKQEEWDQAKTVCDLPAFYRLVHEVGLMTHDGLTWTRRKKRRITITGGNVTSGNRTGRHEIEKASSERPGRIRRNGSIAEYTSSI